MNQKRNNRAEGHYYSDRLMRKLNKMRFAPSTLIEAPSGYGKTTAVRDFLRQALPEEVPVFWYTATEEDFASGYRRFCREIEKIDCSAGELLHKIGIPNAVTIGEAMDVLRSMKCSYETYLVLDNFQILHSNIPDVYFAALLEHGCKDLHIVVITQMLKKNAHAAVATRGLLHIMKEDLRLSSEDIQNYFTLATVSITPEQSKAVEQQTEGWIIAVYLCLHIFMEKGELPDTMGILSLMERLLWDSLTEEQKVFLLRISPFKMITVQQACTLLGCEQLPDYAYRALESPLIHFEQSELRYELHNILTELLIQKRKEWGITFEKECLLRAGDYCREEEKTAEALGFYARINDYERMLSLDLSQMILETINQIPFSELALEIALNCPFDIKKQYILSMLRIGWALFYTDQKQQYQRLMDELHEMPNLKEDESLMGEWLLLSAYRYYPDARKMTSVLKQAAPCFRGSCSQVIRPAIPWGFGNHSPLGEFHILAGHADREADDFEQFILVYSRLTNGHGSGADALFRAELAYNRGDINEAEILLYKAVFLAEGSGQNIIQLGAALYLAHIAVHKSDISGWQRAISSMERAVTASPMDTFVSRSALDIIRGVLLNELEHHTDIEEWLKDSKFEGHPLTEKMSENALFVHLSYLMHQGEHAQVVGKGLAVRERGFYRNPYRKTLLLMMMAISSQAMGNHHQAVMLVESAAKNGLPDGLIFPFAAYSWLMNRSVDELVLKECPHLYENYMMVKDRFGMGWTDFRESFSLEELLADLTTREFEIAKLAADGLRNREIASALNVSESTVRSHLRTVFQKLQIDRRAKLAEMLK